MNSEPVLIIGAVLAALPSLVPVVAALGPPGQIVGGVLSAVGVGLAFYLRSKVSPATPPAKP